MQAAGWVWGHPAGSGWVAVGRRGGVCREKRLHAQPGHPVLGPWGAHPGCASYMGWGASWPLFPSDRWMQPSHTLAGSCGRPLATKGTAIGVLSEYGWPCPPGEV